MNKLHIAQTAASLTVGAIVRKYTREFAQKTTNLPDLTVEVGSGVAGVIAAEKTKPTTDALVAQAAIWLKKNFVSTP